MKLKAAFGFLAFFLIYNLLIFYIGFDISVWLENTFGVKKSFYPYLIIGICSYAYIISKFFDPFSIFKIIGSYWFGFIQYALLIFPIANLAISLLNLPILWTGIVVTGLFIIIFTIGTFNAYSPVIRNYEISIPKKTSRKTLRLAVASDMHFGTLSGVKHVKRLVNNMKNINADLILLPGDIVDDDPKVFIEKKMNLIMKELSAPLGVYGVLGNHEYYGKMIPEVIHEMNEIGVNILTDEVIKIDDFYLVGRKDKTEQARKSFDELTKDLDKSFPIIAMDHQPTDLSNAEISGVDLLLSGHTHRGQMAPNHFITKKMFENDWGYLKKNNMHSVVSSGFGFWGPPLRIGSRSEIVVIDITFN